MKPFLVAAAAFLTLVAADPARSALTAGVPAPDFSTRGAQGDRVMTVALAELLKQGPVVLFFFPSAFVDAPACRDFADHFEGLSAAGASVVGMSRDSVETLARFSKEACAAKFPMASAAESVVNAFDVNDGAMFNTRTTYVIAPSGSILFVHDNEDFAGHAGRALAFVEGMKK